MLDFFITIRNFWTILTKSSLKILALSRHHQLVYLFQLNSEFYEILLRLIEEVSQFSRNVCCVRQKMYGVLQNVLFSQEITTKISLLFFFLFLLPSAVFGRSGKSYSHIFLPFLFQGRVSRIGLIHVTCCVLSSHVLQR